MLTYVISDLFLSPARVLVNTVNTVGVMGKGIAKDFKQVYPDMFQEYQRLCEEKKLDIGRLHLFRTPHKWILNFPTKRHWRQPSKPEYIEAGLKSFVSGYGANQITRIAFPQLGCGNGELDWESQVNPLVEQYLGKLPIQVFIHLYPKQTLPAEHRNIDAMKAWLRDEPESLAFSEVWDDLTELMKDRSNFSAVDTNRAFGVRLTEEPEPGLVLDISGESSPIFMPRDAVLDIWQYLRSVGVLTPDSLTYGLDGYAPEIFGLLTQLPYVRETRAAKTHPGTAAQFAPSIQLVPRARGRAESRVVDAVATEV